MLLAVFYILAATGLLYLGTNGLIKAGSTLALKTGISPLVTGLTVVAFGFSSPALFVSVNAALSGHGNMAIGTVIGSNVFNICVILGLSSVITSLSAKLKLIKIEIPVLVLATLGFILLFAERQISRFEGGILLAGLVLYTFIQIILARREKEDEANARISKALSGGKMKWYWAAGMIAGGIGLLIAGSGLLIKGAVSIAQLLGVGETIISLTIIGAGASVPQLVSSLVAAIRKENEIVVGNVIGSSIFNILGVIGLSAIINPLSSLAFSNIDLFIILGVTLLLIPFLRSNYTLKRDEGIFMIVLYLIYVYYLWPK
jgi:cation:H+ antiporter